MRTPQLSRRELLRAGLIGAGAFALSSTPARASAAPRASWPVTATYDFNQGWRFGGLYAAGSQDPDYRATGYAAVTLPHTATSLSWGDWNPTSWEQLFIYRKQFSAAQLPLGRSFLRFEGVMTNATVYLNGIEIATHVGGYLPFSVELTDVLLDGENILGVVVDGRALDVPPTDFPAGVGAIDYLQPAGIHRDVTLDVVPHSFISDLFAKPVDVLTGAPGLEVSVSVDSAQAVDDQPTVTVALLDGARTVATATTPARIRRGTSTVVVTLSGLAGIALWSPDSPTLYTVSVTLAGTAMPSHTVTVRTGFRQASFQTGGFFLNGERLQIFGVNRHGLYPYTGMAACARLQARDAQLIKQVLNCNMVRCSHYPQSPDFLDACDELGLMVWEEPPGWQYIGDDDFEAVFLQNVRDMVVRDRNRPSLVVWGTRLDETVSYPTLYAQARQLAYDLDGTRQTTGAMDTRSLAGWAEDVFAYDDYDSGPTGAELQPPIPGIPYLVSEAVGALDGPPLFRWIDSSATLATQARLHAQVHAIARTDPGFCGLLAWCAIDYASLDGGVRVWQNLRWPGVLDTFRVPKPGAAFYRSQLSPSVAPVIIPAFYWDFGPGSPATGPGPGTMLATNCDSLEVYVGGQLLTSATPGPTAYGSLPYPPVIVDLTVADGASLPELTVVGYVAGTAAVTLHMSADTATDQLVLDLEDPEITGDGTDATRLGFRALDAYGNQRPYVAGDVTLSLTGTTAELVGQNPFAFALYGGVGSVFLRSVPGGSGPVTVTAAHPTLGAATATLNVVAAGGLYL